MRYEYRIMCKPTGAWVWGSAIPIRSRSHAQAALANGNSRFGCSTYALDPPYETRRPPHAHRIERRAVGAWERM